MQSRRFAIGVTMLLTCLVRLGPMLALATYQFKPKDGHWAFGHEWARLAKWLLERGMFSLDGEVPTAAWDPLYAFVIVPFFQVFGIYTTPAAVAILLFQMGLCALTTCVIFVLAENLYGAFEARVAALLFAFYPASVFFAIQRVGPASLIVLLIGVLFLATLALQRSQRRRYALLGGVVMGLLILTSSQTQSLLLVIPLWWLAGNGRRSRHLISGLLFVAATCLTVLPWSIRNGVTLGTFAPSRADFSYHLWCGNNPQATGYVFTSPYVPEGVTDVNAVSQAAYRRMAMSWIVQHPGDFARLTMKRMLHFWYQIAEERRLARQNLADTVHTWSFMTIVGLALVGVCGSIGYVNRVSLVLLFLAVYPLVFYLTHVSLYRYRFPIEPFLLILAARGLYGLWYGVIRRGRRGDALEDAGLGAVTKHQAGAPVGA